MKTNIITLAALAAAALGVSGTQAQQEQVPREHRMGRAVPAASFINREVVTQSGKNVGQIEELIYDMESGRVLYVALNRTGAGKGDTVAVPPQLFSLQGQQPARKDDVGGLRARQTGRSFVIRANEQALQGAPKFQDTPEKLAQASYVDKIYAHFNQPRWWEGASGDSKAGKFNHIRGASNAKSFAVQNPSNQKLGQVETVLFDLPAGRVSYVVLDPAGSIANKQLLIPVPPMAFTRAPEGGRVLILDADKEKLNNAPAINRDELKAEDIQRLSNPSFAAKVYNYYGKQPWFQSENIPSPTGPDRQNDRREKDNSDNADNADDDN